MCRFINLNIDMSELEEWFSDYDRRIDFYEKKIFILANDYPVLPIVTREGILKAKWGPVRKMRIYNAKEIFLTIPTFLTTLRYV